MTWVGTYILDDDGNPVLADTLTWARWFETHERHVADTDLGAYGRVSTVFLGLDHNFLGIVNPITYRPILWETMVFGGPLDGETRRYASRAEAQDGHDEMVAEAKLVKSINEEVHRK